MTDSPSIKENGIIVVDKPVGMTSAQVVAKVKRITGARKVGHTGTLDPFATGLMICGINGGTRISRFFLASDKTYEAGLRLGVDTDTMDCTGSVVKTCEPDFFTAGREKYDTGFFTSLFSDFEGAQDQLPPVYSALKHNGVPLYKLARRGEPVQKPPRRITIHRLRQIKLDLPSITFEVSCSSGTYIRTLASDIGARIGCGGHLFSLRRTETCGFTVGDAVTLEELAASENPAEFIISMNDALPDMVEHIADKGLEAKISNGVGISSRDGIEIPESDEEDVFIKVLDQEKRVIAILNYIKNGDNYNYCCVFHS